MRTRSFDIDEAVDTALDLFWRKGYDGTSLSDLTEAIGINRPSLYAAFGSKEQLFTRVVERYLSRCEAHESALAEPDARTGVERLLRFYADVAGEPDRPRGCLLVQGALACDEGSGSVRDELTARRHAFEAQLRERLRRAKAAGQLPSDASAGDLARFYWTVCNGMAVQAAGGATREQLRRVVAAAMRAWPK